MHYLDGKTILITWGIWTIGGALVNTIKNLSNYKQIRILDNRETELAIAKNSLRDIDNLRFLFGDIRDKNRLRWAMNGVDVVFHAAAMKHVNICESNPLDAVYTNIIWTQNLIELSLELEIERFTYISTDKAVNPTNVMWATKLIWERLVHAMIHYKWKSSTKFSAVRFWNVLWSRWSVLDMWPREFDLTGRISVTDPLMTRFFMAIESAANLVIKAAEYGEWWEIFILKMGSKAIGDLAKEFLLTKGITSEYEKYINIIGRFPGEKLHEELILDGEEELLYENEEMFVKIAMTNTIPDWFIKSSCKTFRSWEISF